jgi:hypothetical protein
MIQPDKGGRKKNLVVPRFFSGFLMRDGLPGKENHGTTLLGNRSINGRIMLETAIFAQNVPLNTRQQSIGDSPPYTPSGKSLQKNQ